MTDSFDPVADGRVVHETVISGGVAIFRADVGYAIVGHTEPAIKRIYEAKQRSFSKPCGMFGSFAMFEDVVEIGAAGRRFVGAVIFDNNLPLSILAPFPPGQPLFGAVAAVFLAHSSK